ncbi:LON peptidase substrate-binding domain-containing protein [Shewanella gaetbuli]
MNIPIFPLPICILPSGYSQLRIFEARYKRLVTETLKTGSGFGLCMFDESKKQIYPTGTLCHIIDFETLDDGLLGITIRGEQKFVIEDMSVESDGLKRAEVNLIPDWPKSLITDKQPDINNENGKLSQMLKNLLQQYPQHLARYKAEDFNDMAWVCQRWLEIIPVTCSEKYPFINSHDHKAAQDFLTNIINE